MCEHVRNAGVRKICSTAQEKNKENLVRESLAQLRTAKNIVDKIIKESVAALLKRTAKQNY